MMDRGMLTLCKRAQHPDQQGPPSAPYHTCNCPLGPLHPLRNPNVSDSPLTCTGSTRVSGPFSSRGVPHTRQGAPGSTGSGNSRRLIR